MPILPKRSRDSWFNNSSKPNLRGYEIISTSLKQKPEIGQYWQKLQFWSLISVDDDVTPRGRINTRFRQSKRFHVRIPADGPQEAVGFERSRRCTRICLDSKARARGIFLHLRHLRILHDLDSGLLHFLGDPIADIGIECPQHLVLPDDRESPKHA